MNNPWTIQLHFGHPHPAIEKAVFEVDGCESVFTLMAKVVGMLEADNKGKSAQFVAHCRITYEAIVASMVRSVRYSSYSSKLYEHIRDYIFLWPTSVSEIRITGNRIY